MLLIFLKLTEHFEIVCFAGRLGDSFYISPEMVLNRAHGKASDIWSVGVLLHILLSGTQPFLGTGESLRYAICNGELNVSFFFLLNLIQFLQLPTLFAIILY